MNLREECLKAVATGLPKATLAKRIQRDSSTLYKWLDGTRSLSKEVEEEVRMELKKIKKQWEEINV